MSQDNSTSSGGIGFLGLLTIAFIVLKILGFLAWSWLWVLAPMWIPLALLVGFLIVLGIVTLIAKLLSI